MVQPRASRGKRMNAYVRTFGRGTRLCLFRRHSALDATQFAHGSLRSHLTLSMSVYYDACRRRCMVWVKRDGPFEHDISRMRAHRHGTPNSPPASRYGGMNKVEYAAKRVASGSKRRRGMMVGCLGTHLRKSAVPRPEAGTILATLPLSTGHTMPWIAVETNSR